MANWVQLHGLGQSARSVANWGLVDLINQQDTSASIYSPDSFGDVWDYLFDGLQVERLAGICSPFFGPVNWIGFSAGGCMAQAMLVFKPERVRSVVSYAGLWCRTWETHIDKSIKVPILLIRTAGDRLVSIYDLEDNVQEWSNRGYDVECIVISPKLRPDTMLGRIDHFWEEDCNRLIIDWYVRKGLLPAVSETPGP
jgi:hypothetical protein